MSEYKISIRFSLIKEVELPITIVDVDSEHEAIDTAFAHEDIIFDELRQKYGDSFELIEFIAVKSEEYRLE